MTDKKFATQGSPYYRTDSAVQSAYNAATRAVSSFDALKKDHAGVMECDRRVKFNELDHAADDLIILGSKLKVRVAIAAAFEGIVLEES